MQKQNKKYKKLIPQLAIGSALLLSACYSPANSSLVFVAKNQQAVNKIPKNQLEGKIAVDPKEYEQQYLKLIQEQFQNDPKLKTEFQKKEKISDDELDAKLLEKQKEQAINYAHYQYLNERTMSLYFSKMSNKGDIGGGFGTGWFVDRLKNANGTWSNDFIVSTNVHVINQIAEKKARDQEDGNKGYSQKVLELKVAKLAYNWETINDSVRYLSSNHYQKLDGWYDQQAFNAGRRLFLSKAEDTNITNTLNFIIDPSNANSYSKYVWGNFNSKISNKKTIADFWANINDKKLLALNLKQSLSRDVDPTFYEEEFLLPNIEATAGIDLANNLEQEDWNKINSENVKKEFLKRLSYQANLDQAFIKLTINDEILEQMFPIFANPQKYNEWTFPKILANEKITLPLSYQESSFYGVVDGNNKYVLQDAEKFKIWHAGYPLEQTNRDLNYRSPGPTFKGGTGVVDQYEFKANNNSNLFLDHIGCLVYSTFCFNDYVKPGGITIQAPNSNTGGGSSGSLALDKDYNAIGIYWGSQPNGERGIKFKTKGLYELFQVSEQSNRTSLFETFENASTKDLRIPNNPKAENLLNLYLKNLIRLQYQKNQAYKHYQAHKDKYNAIDFSDHMQIKSDVQKVFDMFQNNTYSAGNLQAKNPKQYDDNVKMLYVLKELNAHIKSTYNEVNDVDSKITAELLGLITEYFKSYPHLLNYKITPMYARRIGKVDVKTKIENYLVNHSMKSYLYNK